MNASMKAEASIASSVTLLGLVATMKEWKKMTVTTPKPLKTSEVASLDDLPGSNCLPGSCCRLAP